MNDTTTAVEIVKPCHWTNGGSEVLIVKCLPPNGIVRGSRDAWAKEKHGKSYEFAWPLTVGATVEATDWDERAECGGGLHGWPWGLSIGDGKEPDWNGGVWVVFGSAPSDGIVDLNGKCKCRKGIVRFVSGIGDWQEATNFVLAGQVAWVQYAARGAASATGARGAASATGARGAASATGWNGAASATGWNGAASATGWNGAASATGESGAASATGWNGAASATGWNGAASATGGRGAASATGGRGAASATGWNGAASATGESGAAVVTGMNGRVRGGQFGCVCLAWLNGKDNRAEMRCAEIGIGDGLDGKLKANVWYVMSVDGQFVEAS